MSLTILHDNHGAENHNVVEMIKVVNSCEIKNIVGFSVPKVTDMGKMERACKSMYTERIRIRIIERPW